MGKSKEEECFALTQRRFRRLEGKLLLLESLKDKSDTLYTNMLSELNEKEKELNITIKELERQRREKENLLKEIHHRVKNNLQIVSSLLRFQEDEVEDPIIIAKLESTLNRIMLIAKMHENMYKSSDLIHVDLRTYFKEILSQLIESYTIGQEISLDIKIPSDIKFGMKTIIPLGLLINEIVSNSCMHAFIGRKSGAISLSIESKESMLYQLIINDNGVGIDRTSQSTSLGTQLIEIFTEQLEGTLEIDVNGGTKHTLDFKSIDEN